MRREKKKEEETLEAHRNFNYNITTINEKLSMK
jgi:hypothetical protein